MDHSMLPLNPDSTGNIMDMVRPMQYRRDSGDTKHVGRPPRPYSLESEKAKR
jgi:hypothetical protein